MKQSEHKNNPLKERNMKNIRLFSSIEYGKRLFAVFLLFLKPREDSETKGKVISPFPLQVLLYKHANMDHSWGKYSDKLIKWSQYIDVIELA